MKPRILVVEDEPIIRTTMQEFLVGEGYPVTPTALAKEAVEAAKRGEFEIAICDVQLPDGDGIGLFRHLQQIHPDISGLIITAYATVENAVEAFKAGAFDYLTKPVIFEDLLNKLQRLSEVRTLHRENQLLRRELASRGGFDRIVGSSNAIQAVRSTIQKVSATNSNILLVGETGTGKELIARTIHASGPTAKEKFSVVNCGIRPTSTLEAQLFGAQSGDGTEQPGLLRQTGLGTVFLDEVGELPSPLQMSLLRAIEYREITPVGGGETVPVHTRMIFSTSSDLQPEVEAGRFEQDLFYRLDGVKLPIPPLRERLDDIPELVDYFVEKHATEMGKRVSGASGETIQLLIGAHWRGNVRQLDNAIERAVMMCEGREITPRDLPPDLLGMAQPLPNSDDLRSALRHYERLHITRVLRNCPDKREAAKRLKLGLSSLYRKIEELDIDLDNP